MGSAPGTTQVIIADVHDWGTHPYATADEKGPSLTLYMYNAQEKKHVSQQLDADF